MSSPDNNYFYINFGDGVTSMTFTYNGDFQVTSGEDKGTVVVTTSSNQITIDAQADRKGSSSVADWFNDNIGNDASHAVTNTSIGDDLPDELNFAFSGVLNINGETYTLYIGQGHNAGGNPWWVGCNSLDDGLLGTGYQVRMNSNYSCTIGWASGVSDNEVSLTGATGMFTACSYNGDLHITDGAPYVGVSVDSSDSANVVITVDADRKASTEVADWFNEQLQNSSVRMIADQSILKEDDKPSELNFAFSVSITIDGGAYTVYLGQGNYMLTNNWWFGSNDLFALDVFLNIGYAALIQTSKRKPRLVMHAVKPEGANSFQITQLLTSDVGNE